MSILVTGVGVVASGRVTLAVMWRSNAMRALGGPPDEICRTARPIYVFHSVSLQRGERKQGEGLCTRAVEGREATTEVRVRPAHADFSCPRWVLELWRLATNA